MARLCLSQAEVVALTLSVTLPATSYAVLAKYDSVAQYVLRLSLSRAWLLPLTVNILTLALVERPYRLTALFSIDTMSDWHDSVSRQV